MTRDGWRAVGGLSLEDHDYVIWLGDLNYRIDLPNDEVRAKVAAGELAALLEADGYKSVAEAVGADHKKKKKSGWW